MGPSPVSPLPSRSAYRLFFLFAALDQVGWGLWAMLGPQHVLTFLQVTPVPEETPPDQVRLLALLGALAFAQAVFLVILMWRPERCGALIVAPLLSQALRVGLWLCIAGADRLALPSPVPPLVLAGYDITWLLAFAWFLWDWQHWRRRKEIAETREAS